MYSVRVPTAVAVPCASRGALIVDMSSTEARRVKQVIRISRKSSSPVPLLIDLLTPCPSSFSTIITGAEVRVSTS